MKICVLRKNLEQFLIHCLQCTPPTSNYTLILRIEQLFQPETVIVINLFLRRHRSTKVCYVQRSPEAFYTDRNRNTTRKNNMAHFYDDSFLDNVTLSGWQRKRETGEMRANTPSIKSTSSNNVIHLDISDGLRTGLKRPSNGTILPVTYLGVLPEETGWGVAGSSERRHSTPGVQEYVCY